MHDFKEQERNFLDGVWNKVRYLEQMKLEDRKVKARQRRLNYIRFKIGLSSLVICLILLLPVLLLGGLNTGVLVYIGTILISGSLIYDYILHSKLYGGDVL